MKRRLLTWLAVWLAWVKICGAAETNDFFAQGLSAYQAGEFATAKEAFQQSADRQPASGTLLNLGLTEWQRGHAGEAILAWEQAHWLDPFDARAAANLRFARQVLQLNAAELKWYETVSTWLPPNVWVWLAGASLWLAVGLVIMPELLQQRRAGWHQTVAALAGGIFLFTLTASLGVVSRAQIGVVIRKDAALQLTPTKTGEIVATLGAGESSRKLRSRGDYVFIHSADAAGWIDQTQFKLINPE